MKKIKALERILIAVLVFTLTLALAACAGTPTTSSAGNTPDGGGASTPGSDTAETPPVTGALYTIGFNQWGSGAQVFDWQSDEARYLIEEVLGMKLNNVSDEFTPEGTLNNIQNFVAAKVDGVLTACNQPAVLPTAANTLLQGKIPFVLTIMIGEPDQRAKMAEDNAYYSGAIQGSEYVEGYMVGQRAVADGCKTAILTMGNFGELTSEDRIAGFTKAFVDEGGGKILDIARTASPPESSEKSAAMLAANRNADCIYGGVGDYAPGIVSGMETLNISPDDMFVYINKVGEPSAEYIRQGKIKYATGGEDILVPLSALLLINRLDGTPIKNEDGTPLDLQVRPFAVTAENIDRYVELYFGYTKTGKHALSADTLKSFLTRYNPNVTAKDFVDFCDGLTLEKLESQTWK